MKGIMREYTSALLGLMGSLCILSVISQFFVGENSFFAVLIKALIQGGV